MKLFFLRHISPLKGESEGALNGRLYDPVVGKMLSPDPFVQAPDFTESYNRYSYCFNNPLKYTDPSGMLQGNWWAGKQRGLTFADFDGYGGGGMGGSSSFAALSSSGQTLNNLTFWNNSFVAGSLYKLSYQGRPGETKKWNPGMQEYGHYEDAHYVDGVGWIGNETQRGYGTEGQVLCGWIGGETCPNCLDPSTVGNNLLGLSYPGSNNPKSINKTDNFSYVPTNPSEYPAIGHDRRYRNLKISGGSGLFTDTRAIGADWQFVAEELAIANFATDFTVGFDAQVLALGLGLAVLPKTLVQLSSPLGATYVGFWYNVSNQGVNNVPTIHTH